MMSIVAPITVPRWISMHSNMRAGAASRTGSLSLAGARCIGLRRGAVRGGHPHDCYGEHTSRFSNSRARARLRAGAAPPGGQGNSGGLDGRLGDMDANQLQTALAVAIRGEDYALAARIRDRLQQLQGGGAATLLSWEALGIPNWLTDRAERLGFKFPTAVQRRSSPVISSGADTVVRGQTGCGKTLSFLLPSLGRLGYPPDVWPDDLAGPQLLVVVPTLELGVQVALLVYKLFGGNMSTGTPGDEAGLFTYVGPRGLRVRGVLSKQEMAMAKQPGAGYVERCHVVVGTPRQVVEAMRGPDAVPLAQHTRVVVVDEVDECWAQDPEAMRLLLAAACSRRPLDDVISGTAGASAALPPQPRGAPAPAPPPPPTAPGGGGGGGDDGSAAVAAAVGDLSSTTKPQVVFVGATMSGVEVTQALWAGWLSEPVVVEEGPGSSSEQGVVPAGLVHRYVVVPDAGRRYAVLSAMLRDDFKKAAVAAARDAAALPDGTTASSPPQPRVVVFVNSEDEARKLAEPLRGSLWTEHRLSVLLPTSGGDPVEAMLAFRDSRTTLLLSTSSSARGLDMPAVSHVYSCGVCPGGASEYVHRAGRTGRIGSLDGGVVTSIVTPEEEVELKAMAEQLGIVALQRVDAPPLLVAPRLEDGVEPSEEDVEAARRGFEDLFNLM